MNAFYMLGLFRSKTKTPRKGFLQRRICAFLVFRSHINVRKSLRHGEQAVE